MTAQVRTLATLLQAPALCDRRNATNSSIRTGRSMVYFNSLRELGRASTLVQADIREYLNAVWDRIGLMRRHHARRRRSQLRRFINNFDELTSRMRSSDIPASCRSSSRRKPSRDVVDLCYATNMIQVGLDVPRLSLMSIVGQPKGASEYIQASSRVGRGADKPGLVVTNYNPFKPRDRSHFESFRSFHENAYRHVEPTSVTPFCYPGVRAGDPRACGHARPLPVSRTCATSPQSALSPAERGRDHPRHHQPGFVGRPGRKRHGRERRSTASSTTGSGANRKSTEACLGTSLDPADRTRQDGSSARPEPSSSTLRPTATSMRNVDADCEATPIPLYLSGVAL